MWAPWVDDIAGMAEGNERGSSAEKLARLIAAVDIRIAELACNPPSEYLSNHVVRELRAAIEEAKR